MTDRELLELIASQVGALTTRVDTLSSQVGTLSNDMVELKNGQGEIKSELRKTNIVIENDIKPKVEALFDGYSLRGDQIELLQEQLNERLDTIQTDLSYVVGKTAQHERSFIKLNKKAE